MRQERLFVLVGLFVGAAISLSILTALYVYNEFLHDKVETYVMFFNGSLSGLHVNSDITYRGVKIGEVKLIELTEDREKNQIKIPVYVQFFVERSFIGKQNPIRLLIKQGFVANIKKPNFITGVASINLIRSKEPITHQLTNYRGYPVFPTNNMIKDHTTLEDTFKTAKKAFEDISKFTQSERVNGAFDATKTMADSMDNLIQSLDKLLPPTFANLNESLTKLTTLTLNLEQIMPSMFTSFNKSMKDVANAASSTQNLTDYLSRYPESLLRGKQ